MKKSIIALVIAGLPLAASAEVILYGQIKSSVTVGQVKIKGDAGSETSALPQPASMTIPPASVSKAAKTWAAI